MHEVSMPKCTIITKSVQWVGTEVCDLPTEEGLPNLESFLTDFEDKVIENQHLLSLELALKDTPARWWVAHKKTILEWPQCLRLMEFLFGENILYTGPKYTRLTNHVEHIEHCHVTLEAFLQ